MVLWYKVSEDGDKIEKVIIAYIYLHSLFFIFLFTRVSKIC